MSPSAGVSIHLVIACCACAVVSVAQATPWTTFDATPVTDPDGPHMLLVYDMEGLSGQDDVYTWYSTHPVQYAKGRRLLTDDVNAVIDGLFAGGARAVSVVDGHGSGNLHDDILVDEVDPRAKLISGTPDGNLTFAGSGAFDALVAVGMHARSGSGGFSAHTSTRGIEIVINGRPVNETEMSALAHGEDGIPLIFASGDDVLGRELETLPWIEYVTVKTATGPMDAEPVPLNDARRKLRAGAKRAVQRLDRARVVRVSRPVEVSVRAYSPADLSWLSELPGIDYRNEGISFVAPDFPEASRRIRAIVSAAMFNNFRIVLSAAMQHEDWKEVIEAQAVEELTRLWNESETSRIDR